MKKLINKLPEVPKPFNMAYHETWETMSSYERKVSLAIDIVIVLVVISLLIISHNF